tara:strand:- start:731 stop:1159 length:429 start_codon:yes stop_codon:yes gene_type:complete
MEIIAYKYDADYNCIDCTIQKFKQPLAINLDVDENGLGVEIEDSEGNIVAPLFKGDEWYELDESYLIENPTQQVLNCGTCHKKIDSYNNINWATLSHLENIEAILQDFLLWVGGNKDFHDSLNEALESVEYLKISETTREGR